MLSFETSLIKQKAGGSIIDFDEIQREDAQPSENTSLHQHEVDHDVVDPQTDVIPVHRSARIPQAPKRYGFYIDVEEHELGDHREPPNYQDTLSNPESEKWLEAMNAEMQSMKDNQVCNLFDLPSNCKTFRSKWLFKKKTDMDGNIHTYKAHLVKKGFTQTYGVYYKETFSPVADIKAIRILIAIPGIDTSKRGTIPMQPNLDLRKSQGPSTPAEVKRIQGIPYASDVGSIMYDVRCTRPDVANTKDMFLVYGGDSTTELSVTCYTDASWETDRDDLRSQTGYVFVMNGGAFDWKSSKQSTTTMSSMEAEYIAAAEAAIEAIWIRKFIPGLGVIPSINKPMDMYCDNTGAITISDELGV
ncbi:putative retrotransposon protein [Tanacetum coccineum]